MAKKKDETATTEQVQTELNVTEGGEQGTVPFLEPLQDVAASTEQQLSAPTEPPKTVRAVFLTNCTHNRDRYQAGQKEDLPEDVFEILLEAKAVRRLGE